MFYFGRFLKITRILQSLGLSELLGFGLLGYLGLLGLLGYEGYLLIRVTSVIRSN